MKQRLGHRTTALIAIAATLVIADSVGAQLVVEGRPFSGASDAATDSDASSNSLTQRVQRDLVALGYEPGSINGTMDDDTIIAIAKFQAENGLTPDGQVSPLLAGVLSARVDAMRSGSASESVEVGAPSGNLAAASPATDSDCERETEESVEDAERRGRLADAGSRLLRRFGGDSGEDALETANDVAELADIVDDLDGC